MSERYLLFITTFLLPLNPKIGAPCISSVGSNVSRNNTCSIGFDLSAMGSPLIFLNLWLFCFALHVAGVLSRWAFITCFVFIYELFFTTPDREFSCRSHMTPDTGHPDSLDTGSPETFHICSCWTPVFDQTSPYYCYWGSESANRISIWCSRSWRSR